MGVQGLHTFIKNNHKDIVETVDLVEKAKDFADKMKILIDFNNFEYFLRERFVKSLSEINKNPYIILDGGEFDKMTSYLQSFIEVLRSVNIEPVFYFDGAKGSSFYDANYRIETWIRRYSERQQVLEKYFQFLRGEVST